MDSTLKEWTEWASHLSDVFVAVAALFGLQQISILKKDIQTRNKRAAGEKAIEAVERYGVFADQASVYFNELREQKLPTSYSGPVGDFTPASVPSEWQPTLKKRMVVISWIPAVNTLDSLAAAFVFGVADETTGFTMVGRSFCANVGYFYDLIAAQRKDDVQPHFQAVVQLYKMWSNRLSQEGLQSSAPRHFDAT